ncbi:hypothetical protein HK104_010675 [Borealophlyctis nickersoniae]|nr:hypothetical protein HK104_010675 [Borealophlyctis nickersoniae]
MEAQVRRASHATVTSADAGAKLAKYIRNAFPTIPLSKSQAHACFKESAVLVNGKVARETQQLFEGDVVTLFRTVDDCKRARDYVKVEIEYEDAHLAIVSKPSGIALAEKETHTLELALPYNLIPAVGPDALPHPECINFMDNATQGLAVVAKTKGAKAQLRRMHDQCEMVLKYHVMCHGNVETTSGKSIGESFVIDDDIRAQPAATSVKILSTSRTRNSPTGFLSTLEVIPIGGTQRHQPRIHLLNRGHPVIGQSKYTLPHRTARDKGLFMALTGVQFKHPLTGQDVVVQKPEPAKFEAFRIRDAKAWDRKKEEDARELSEAGGGSREESESDTDGDLPVAYVTGQKDFFNLRFHVTPSVMIPRPASQTLVRVALRYISETATPRVLDLGTGSGCLLISILSACAMALGVGLDASEGALDVARGNAERLGVGDRARFVVGKFDSVGDALLAGGGRDEKAATQDVEKSEVSSTVSTGMVPAPFDVVVCNPPYLTKRKARAFETRSLENEPESALFAGPTGYEAYVDVEAGLGVGTGVIKDGTVLVVEVGHGMADRVVKIFEGKKVQGSKLRQDGRWQFLEMVRDDKELERCLVFRRVAPQPSQ